jgi:hypothetical protein
MARVVIDTEGVRSLAQYTRGAVEQVARIRTELAQVRQILDTGRGAAHFGPLLAALTDYATVLSDDHHSLVTEVLTIEQEEGDAPQGTEPARPADANAAQIPAVLRTLPIFNGGGPRPLPPPQPWNTTWVLPGGAIPVGTGTRVGPGGNNGDQDGFGPTWTQRAGAGNAHGGQSWASYQAAAQRAAQAGDGGSGGWGEGDAPDPGPVEVDDGSGGHQRGFDAALHSAVTGYGDLVGDTAKGFGQAAVDYTKGLGEGLKEFGSDLGDAASDLFDGIKNAADDVWHGRVADAATDLFVGVYNAGEDVGKAYSGLVVAAAKGFVQGAVDIGTGYVDGVSGFATSEVDAAQSGMEGVADGSAKAMMTGHSTANDDLFDNPPPEDPPPPLFDASTPHQATPGDPGSVR